MSHVFFLPVAVGEAILAKTVYENPGFLYGGQNMSGYHHGPEPVFAGCFLLFVILIAVAINLVTIIAFCRIYSRAGYPWAMGLLMLIPVVNFIMMLILAFSEWPIQKQLKQLQQQLGSPSAPRENFRNL